MSFAAPTSSRLARLSASAATGVANRQIEHNRASPFAIGNARVTSKTSGRISCSPCRGRRPLRASRRWSRQLLHPCNRRQTDGSLQPDKEYNIFFAIHGIGQPASGVAAGYLRSAVPRTAQVDMTMEEGGSGRPWRARSERAVQHGIRSARRRMQLPIPRPGLRETRRIASERRRTRCFPGVFPVSRLLLDRRGFQA